jgi:hypothetical protein
MIFRVEGRLNMIVFMWRLLCPKNQSRVLSEKLGFFCEIPCAPWSMAHLAT